MNLEEPHKKTLSISAFDLDHTLLTDNSSYRFGRYLYRKKLLSFGAFAFIIGCHLRHAAGWLPIAQLHETAFSLLFKGRSSSLIKKWAADFVHENITSLLYAPAIEKLKQAQEGGHLTVILSSSPDFIVEPIAKKLNVSCWKATQYGVDKKDCYCEITKLLLGNDKAFILNELGIRYGTPKQKIHAYSDSHLDLPFLTAAGTACGVNPNRQLRSICYKNDWSII